MSVSGENILVTGGAGYVGSHACKALAAAGFTPIVYDSLVRGNRWAVKWGPLVVGDLLDEVLLRDTMRKYKPVGVIHFAAFAYVGESMIDPMSYYRNNVGGTISLLRAMAVEGIDRMVFSSTCATYGIPKSNPISEDTLQLPINPYGSSKLMVERILTDQAECCGLNVVALRYFNAAGADAEGEIGEAHEPETHLIPLALAAGRVSGQPITVFGDDHPTFDGTCIRDFVHVCDLADAHVLAFEYTDRNEGFFAFNLGSGEGTSIREVINEVKKVTGREVLYTIGNRRAGDPATLIADPSLARRELGWTANRSNLRTILKTTWNWMEKQ